MSDIYEISINVLPVASRPCRHFQESIAEYAMDGRPRFEWEAMRHQMILYEDQTVPLICASCPMNILQGPEGCKGTLYGLELFMRAVARLVPDSPWANLETSEEPISAADTRVLCKELDSLEQVLSKSKWRVAQLYADGAPLTEFFSDGSERPKLYPWNGEAPPSLINSNEGYQLFLCAHGIIVKSNYEDPVPHVFTRLTRDGSGVYGTSDKGETVGFQSVMAHYPEWDKENPRGFGELRSVELNAAEVFRDTLDMLQVFTGVAGSAETGIGLTPAI